MAETFQEQLKRSVLECPTDKLDRKEVLIDIFKTYAARMIEQNVMTNKNRIEGGFIMMLRGYMISEFRSVELGEHQLSEAQYADLFDKTIKEIFDSASNAHEGDDKVERQPQNLEVNKNAYSESKGFKPSTSGKIWVPT
jgi:hypothetical protein